MSIVKRKVKKPFKNEHKMLANPLTPTRQTNPFLLSPHLKRRGRQDCKLSSEGLYLSVKWLFGYIVFVSNYFSTYTNKIQQKMVFLMNLFFKVQ